MSNERKMVIKDAIFETVIMGGNLAATVANLHLEHGFSKEEIVEAIKELRAEAEQ